MKKFIIEIEFDKTEKGRELFISQESTTGCSYEATKKQDILKALRNYLDNYLVDEDYDEDYDEECSYDEDTEYTVEDMFWEVKTEGIKPTIKEVAERAADELNMDIEKVRPIVRSLWNELIKLSQEDDEECGDM